MLRGAWLTEGHLLLQEEMDAARLPYQWRDYCAHLLIPLNDCRCGPETLEMNALHAQEGAMRGVRGRRAASAAQRRSGARCSGTPAPNQTPPPRAIARLPPRANHYYMPWACGHERHVYEKCEYKEFKRRVAIMTEEKRRRREVATA